MSLWCLFMYSLRLEIAEIIFKVHGRILSLEFFFSKYFTYQTILTLLADVLLSPLSPPYSLAFTAEQHQKIIKKKLLRTLHMLIINSNSCFIVKVLQGEPSERQQCENWTHCGDRSSWVTFLFSYFQNGIDSYLLSTINSASTPTYPTPNSHFGYDKENSLFAIMTKAYQCQSQQSLP